MGRNLCESTRELKATIFVLSIGTGVTGLGAYGWLHGLLRRGLSARYQNIPPRKPMFCFVDKQSVRQIDT